MSNYIELKRGGYLVNTSMGPVQVGVPPETIKDTMIMEQGVPAFFILPITLFDWIKGISVAEIEFPLYFNFFVKKQKTHVICHKEQIPRMKNVLQESLFGPEELDVHGDFDTTSITSTSCYFDLKKEIDYFRSSFTLDDLVSFIPFKNNSVSIGTKKSSKNLKINYNESSTSYEIIDNGELLCTTPSTIQYNAHHQLGERLAEPYIPPLFGITCLGPSHGFDPEQNTSGFILWLNYEGVMVDPPVESTEWLINSNVNPKLIDSIILTHCHADHDAGTFQKILEEGKITVYTTETILLSFLRKYSALSGISIDALCQLFTFQPIKIGEPVFIHSAKFVMTYSLHSIPTIAFSMQFQKNSFVYTSDHNNDPAKHTELLEQNVISKKRYEELTNFPWESDIIYHESGIPPLHTPVSFLASLPKQTQEKTHVYHIAEKDFPDNTSLNLARFGIENTFYRDVTPSEHIEAYKILSLLKHIDFFEEIPVSKAQEFITIVKQEKYSKGDRIISKDTIGDKFYIIYMGNVSVVGEDLKSRKIYGSYEYFGEVALVTQQNRAADVYAETNVILYTIERDEFLSFISGTDFESILKRLAKIRTSETWNLLSNSPYFKYCSASQKTWLESMFMPVEYTEKGIIQQEGKDTEFMYIIRNGTVHMSRKGEHVAVLSSGDLIGSMSEIYDDLPSSYTYTYEGDVSLFAMRSSEISIFAEKNPGIVMKIKYNYKELK
ncbi:MAG: cAMP/cGMP-dependent 3',5'-cyclic-AMP/GMP phosphodiesterase [Spirochaetes bacterium]|nr:cAMP/cGMP-dependent 3',5'-cyclic-AMP/GMP phosphodiesterase [Spirochaetota bacterium]